MTMTDDAPIRRLKTRIRVLERALRRAEEQHISFEEVRREILDLREASAARQPKWLNTPIAKGSSPGTPVLLLSDWHMGERVRAAETGGLNAYSREISIRRVHRVVEATIVLARDYMVNPDYPGIVVGLLGDMVTGEIHDELARTNDVDPMPVLLLTVDLLVQALVRLADTFGRVFAPCVSGNHGRTDKKMPAKTFSARNFDWLIYQLVERRLADRGETRIRIAAPEENEVSFAIHGHRFLALHGHDLGVRGGDGIIGALGPIMRGRLKTAGQKASIGQDFDTLLMGHWHQYITLPGLVVNNTLKGFDEYAAKFLRAPPSRPSQALFYVHPEQGLTSHWQVFAEPPTRRPGGQKWVDNAYYP
jgi:predicted phosphodiesterase